MKFSTITFIDSLRQLRTQEFAQHYTEHLVTERRYRKTAKKRYMQMVNARVLNEAVDIYDNYDVIKELNTLQKYWHYIADGWAVFE